jgi:hypothetical protein
MLIIIMPEMISVVALIMELEAIDIIPSISTFHSKRLLERVELIYVTLDSGLKFSK